MYILFKEIRDLIREKKTSFGNSNNFSELQ